MYSLDKERINVLASELAVAYPKQSLLGKKDPRLDEFTSLISSFGSASIVSLCKDYPHLDADNLAQKCVFDALNKFEQFNGKARDVSVEKYGSEAEFTTWFGSVCRNAFRNDLRMLKKRKTFSQASMSGDELASFIFKNIPDTTECAIDHFIASEGTEQFFVFMQKNLHPDHVAILKLRFVEDLDYEAIAEKLDVKIGTVRSRIHRAKEKLAEVIHDKAPELLPNNLRAGFQL